MTEHAERIAIARRRRRRRGPRHFFEWFTLVFWSCSLLMVVSFAVGAMGYDAVTFACFPVNLTCAALYGMTPPWFGLMPWRGAHRILFELVVGT